jgi:hypothetical protein
VQERRLSTNETSSPPAGIPDIVRRIAHGDDTREAFGHAAGDIIIQDTVLIDQDTTIYDNIILAGNGLLTIQNCSFSLKGNILAFENSRVSVGNASFNMIQDFIYEFMFAAFDTSAIEFSNTIFNSSNLPASAGAIGRGSISMDSVSMDAGFITFGLSGSGSVDIRSSNRAGEFVVLGDSANLYIVDSDTVLVWLGFPSFSSGEIHGSPGMGDWVERFAFPDSTCTGIGYTVQVDSIYGLMLATMAADSTNVTVYDANLQSSGNIFGIPVPDTISGLVDDSHYDDWTVPLPGRSLRLVNTSIRAWNLYFYANTALTLRSSIFGECLGSDSSNTFIMNAVCDGFGGHIGASGSSVFISFLMTLYTDALMEQNSLSMFVLTSFVLGHLIARDMAVSISYNTVFANPVQVYDSATVMIAGLYPPSPGYIDDTLSIHGSAAMIKGPQSQFQFDGYKLEYAPAADTTQFFPITGRIQQPVEDGELCEFVTEGLDIGNYVVRLWYFFSAFGFSDSLSFDNALYLARKTGIPELPRNPETSLTISPTLCRSAVSVSYSIPTETRVQLRFYNLAGQMVSMLDRGPEEDGRHTFNWEPHGLASGVYFCQIRTATSVKTQKFVLVR